MDNFQTTKQRESALFSSVKERFGYVNPMQTPRIEKVVVSAGVGSVQDKERRELIGESLSVITGQKASGTRAKKSIASFKLREGDLSGYQVTLRGVRMYAFLDKLIHIVLPRTRDFRGLKLGAVDEMGNYTIGLREHTVFPETADEDVRNVFGMAITIVTTAKTKEEAEALLRGIGLPLRREEEKN